MDGAKEPKESVLSVCLNDELHGNVIMTTVDGSVAKNSGAPFFHYLFTQKMWLVRYKTFTTINKSAV